MNSRLVVILLMLSSSGWGLTWIPAQYIANMGLSGAHLVFVTSLAISLSLLPWIIKQRKLWLPIWPVIIAIFIFGGFANVAFQSAISQGDVIRVMILFYMLPVWSVLGGSILLKERIDKKRLLALILCILGAFSILEVWTLSLTFSWVDLLSLSAGFSLALNNIAYRFSNQTPIISKVGITLIGSTILTGCFILLMPSQETFPNNAIPLAIVYGIFWLLPLTFGTMWSVARLDVGRSSMIIVMELVVAALSVIVITQAYLQLHEIIGSILAISAALIEGMRKTHSIENAQI
ncbi:hypothetical protein AB835_00480 [Candidatus Endobugula sertula]|uniref:EamA domain-containing protein n=1 Tax=Candidatus Endobugula sertula TaxID=62101 RepID=A0A1D2QTW6_9GAMM|nr:hypothetical protein AB835_00480 [Candidatus Endobugula sertula]